MDGAKDGYAYLMQLRERDRGKKQTFSGFADYLEQKARERNIPLNGQFELTPLCNFSCGMCYVHLTEGQLRRPLLTADEWKGLMTRACRAGMLRASLSGGECLAYPGFREVYEHLQDLGCEVDLFTNGALLDEGWVDYFVRRMPSSIHVTLYGDSEEAYRRVTGQAAFERVVRHLRAIREAKLALYINVTPSRFLGEDVFGTIRLARELSRNVTVNAMLSAPREETGRADLDIDADEDLYLRISKFQRELDGVRMEGCPLDRLPEAGGPDREGIIRGLKCGAGRSSFSVIWDGTMVPCNELEMIRAHPLETGFDAAWEAISREAERWPRARAWEGCAYEDLCEKCAGRVRRYAEPGVWPQALCERTQRFVRQGVYQVPDCDLPQ